MIWANLLHIYQPPTQDKDMLDRITEESYKKIILGLKENPRGKLTINMNASLTELFEKYKYNDVLDDIKYLLSNGQIEITESAAYHAFLPLIPKEEVIRQINLNHIINKRILGDVYNPTGFFAPELGVSPAVAKIVSDMGYKWMLFDELAFDQKKGKIKYDRIYYVDGTNLIGYFREREISFKILSAQVESGDIFLSEIKDIISDKRFLATAMDGETFGHHRPGLELLLYDIFKSRAIQCEEYQNLDQFFHKKDTVNINESTWALIPIELTRNQPYERWFNKSNEIHVKQWTLTYFAIDMVNKSKYKVDDPMFTNKKEKLNKNQKQWLKARYMLDKSLHSDQYWWASARPWWSIDMIERGANELMTSILLLPEVDAKIKNKAEDIYKDIVFSAFRWEREYIVGQTVANYDEETTEMIQTKSLDADPKEYDKVINHLRKQMLEASDKENYIKALEYRKRIESLRQKQKEIIKNKHGKKN